MSLGGVSFRVISVVSGAVVPMSQLSTPQVTDEVIYPDSDGQPMASDTEQYRWIVMVQQNLDWLLPDAFVAGDLFWYPIEGRADVVVAPDVMVALGRLKGKRSSYKQWEETGVAPQVVFEILPPSNTHKEMEQKLLFFERHGVEEYCLYDPDNSTLNGFLRGEFGLDHIPDMADWISPLLNVRFDMSGSELQLFRPGGSSFLSYQSVIQQAESAEHRAELAEQKAAKLAEKLRELGIDPEQV